MSDGSARAETLLDALPDAVVVLGEDLRIESLNRAAEQLFGVDRTEAVGRPAGEVFILRFPSTRRLDECLPLGSRAPMSRGIPESQFDLFRTGERIPVTLVGAYEKDQAGVVRRVILSLRNARARDAMDKRTVELISTVSHEIRSPLTSVKGFSQTMLRRWDLFPDDQKKEMLEAVVQDADRIERLLGELLDVSRVESGRLRLRPVRLDVPALANKVVDRLAGRSEPHSLHVRADDATPAVFADADKVEQVLTNLVENAIKYTDSGSITVSVVPGDGTVTVAVSDEGEGIPAPQLSRLFRKFYRRERAGSPTGSGLGLYICRRLIDAHGGSLTAESVSGRGSTFTFTLPVEGPS